MARYVKEVVLNQPGDFVNYIMNDFLTKHGFKLKEFKGQKVFRAGDGFFEIPKFLVYGYQNGVFHLEAWTRNCWLPGVYGKENAMTGYVGCVPKETYKKDIEQLMGLLFQPIPQQSQGGMNVNMQPDIAQGMNQNGPIIVQGVDTKRYATMGFWFSLIGLAASILSIWASGYFWVMGVVFAILGIIYGRKGQKSSKKGLATAGFVLGIITLVVAVILLLLVFLGALLIVML